MQAPLLKAARILRARLCCCCCFSVAQLCLTLRDPMGCSMPGLPIPHYLPEFAQVHVHCMLSILWCPRLLLPLIFPRDFSNESSVCIRWPKYWNFSFSISPSSEYSGLIFLKIDWEPEEDGLKEDGPEELALRSEKGQRKGSKDGGNHYAHGWAPSSTLWPEPRLLSTASGGSTFSIRTWKWALLWHRCGAKGTEEQACLDRALGFASFISKLEVSYKLRWRPKQAVTSQAAIHCLSLYAHHQASWVEINHHTQFVTTKIILSRILSTKPENFDKRQWLRA